MNDSKLLKYSIFGMIGLGALTTLFWFVSMSEAFQYLGFLDVLGGGFAFVKFLLYASLALRAALLGFGIYAFLTYQKNGLNVKFMGMGGILFIAFIVYNVLTLISMLHKLDIATLLCAASVGFFLYALKKEKMV